MASTQPSTILCQCLQLHDGTLSTLVACPSRPCVSTLRLPLQAGVGVVGCKPSDSVVVVLLLPRQLVPRVHMLTFVHGFEPCILGPAIGSSVTFLCSAGGCYAWVVGFCPVCSSGASLLVGAVCGRATQSAANMSMASCTCMHTSWLVGVRCRALSACDSNDVVAASPRAVSVEAAAAAVTL